MGKDTQEMQGDGETDQSMASFMRNTMVSSTMVSGEASETDDEDDDDVGDRQGNEKEDEDSETESKHLKEELETEIHEFELETGAEVKTKRQKIVYKFDS